MKNCLVVGLLSAPAALAFAPASPIDTGHRFSTFSPLTAVINTDENADRDVQTFDQWALDCGVQRSPGFHLTTEDGTEWNAMTREPIPEGGPVLFVPGNMIFSALRSLQEFQELGSIKRAEDEIRRLGKANELPHFALFIKVLVEYERGDQSPWYPWLDSMPRTYYNGAAMTPFCYECLPPLVSKLAMDERVKFINFFQALKEVDFLSDQTKGDRDLAKWAYNVVYTRSFEANGDVCIVPMADMFNHGTETEVEISYDDGNCIACATRDVPEGSPLRLSYGDPTNPSYFFARYGFLDESAPATFCKIVLQPNQKLKDIGYDHSRLLFYKDTGDISEEVWDVMLYQDLADTADAWSKAAADAWVNDKDEEAEDAEARAKAARETKEAFYEAHMRGDVDTKNAIHQQHFLGTSAALKTHIDSFLNQLDELSANAAGRDPNEHLRLPLILKHNEFVRSTFLTVKEQVDAMVAQATGESYA